MNKYTCSNCGIISVIRSTADKIENVKCTCGEKPVTYVKGEHKIEKAAKQNVVAPPQPKVVEAPKPQPPKVFNSQSVQVPVESK